MIDLKKIIKLVKSGNCSYNSFNLGVKKAQGFDDEDDEAANWIAEQEKKEKITPVPSNIPVSQPQSTVLEDVNAAMDAWVASNQRELEAEDRNDIISLQTKKNNSPSDSYLGPDPRLYRALTNDPSLHEVLIDKINNQSSVSNREKASLFVDTMMAKTQGLMGDIEAREVEIAKEEELAKLKQEQMTRKKMEDPYAVAVPLPDPGVDVKAYERLVNLSPAEKATMYDTIHMKYNDEMLSKAIEAKLSAPKDNAHIDQRMNFFLRFPQYLQPVMDQNLQNILKEQLSNMGVEGEDVLNAVGNAYATRGAKKRVSNILNNEKGAELHKILLKLIETADPIIMEWLKGSLFADVQMEDLSYSQPVGDEGRTMEQNLTGLTPADIGDLNINAADRKESSGIIGEIMTQYLLPTIKYADRIGGMAIKDMTSDAIEKHRSASDDKERKEAMKMYTLSEQLNAFVMPLIDHLYDLLETKGQALRTDNGVMMYKNDKGKIHVPLSILKDVYQKDKTGDEGKTDSNVLEELFRKEERDGVNRFDHKALVERYISRIKSGKAKAFVPQWGKMVNYNFPVEEYRLLGELKENIKTLAMKNPKAIAEGSFDFIRVPISSTNQDNLADSLYKFAGVRLPELDEGGNVVEPGDSEEVKIRKINDFIYMTLNQDDKYAKWLVELGPQRGKKFKNASDIFHQLKSIIGGQYTPLLGYLINLKETPERLAAKKMADPDYQPTSKEIEFSQEASSYTPEVFSALISLVDHHPNVRNFMRVGRMPNLIDKELRTNTELYYTLKGEAPPAHIQELSHLYTQGLEESAGLGESATTYKGLLALQTGSWYSSFFAEYDKFDRLLREKEKKELKIAEIEDEKTSYHNYANGKVSKLIEPVTPFDPRKPGDISIYNPKYRRLLLDKKYFPNERNRIAFMEKIRNWDGTSALSGLDYSTLGQKSTAVRLEKMDARIQEITNGAIGRKSGKRVPGINDVNKEMEKVKATLAAILEESGYQPQNPSALRLASEEYRRAMSKIASLERMKKLSMKVASVDYVSIEIARIKTEFDCYFNSLFL